MNSIVLGDLNANPFGHELASVHSVSISVVEEMAKFIVECFSTLEEKR